MIINDAGLKLVRLNMVTRKLVIGHIPVGVSNREGGIQTLSITQLMVGAQHHSSEVAIVITRARAADAGILAVSQVFGGIGLGRQTPVMNSLIASRAGIQVGIPIIALLHANFVVEGILRVIRDDINYSLISVGTKAGSCRPTNDLNTLNILYRNGQVFPGDSG